MPSRLFYLLRSCFGLNREDQVNASNEYSMAQNSSIKVIAGKIPKKTMFYFLGDSLTEFAAHYETKGWEICLRQRFITSIDTLNRGFSGYTTRWMLESFHIIEHELQTQVSPSVITLWLGTNDAALPIWIFTKAHVPLEEYRENLQQLVTRLKKSAPQAILLLITPPPVWDEVAQYAQAVRDIAMKEQNSSVTSRVFLVDIYTMLQNVPSDDFDSYFCDGVHFSSKGNEFVCETILDTIDKYAPELLVRQPFLPHTSTFHLEEDIQDHEYQSP